MKLITFTYTKDSGDVSERTLLAMVTPNNYYAGIDMSDIDDVQAMNFVHEAKIVHEEYLEKLRTLQHKFDLKHSYRQFKPQNMTDITNI
ncbi:MAG TPA: hypothetical protein V6C58_28345 [Allocoleopsis sp.]